MRIAQLNYTDAQIEIVFAALVAQMHDIHQMVWSLTEDQLEEAAQMCEAFTDLAEPLAFVLSAALAYAAHDIDHAAMSDEQITAGFLALEDIVASHGESYRVFAAANG